MYSTIHASARKALPVACAYADDTCNGRLECALRKDAPAELVREDDRGRRYYVGPDPLDGYIRLCRSHHERYDGTTDAARAAMSAAQLIAQNNRSPEHRERQAAAARRNGYANRGREQSLSTRKLRSEALKQYWIDVKAGRRPR